MICRGGGANVHAEEFSHAISGPNSFPCRFDLWVWVLLHKEVHVLFNDPVDVDGLPVLG
jgi:hypothetical protein